MQNASFESFLIFPVPIKAVAQELGLPLHERDTFTGWTVSIGFPDHSSGADYI